MDIVEMVLGGRVNKGLVTLIQQACLRQAIMSAGLLLTVRNNSYCFSFQSMNLNFIGTAWLRMTQAGGKAVGLCGKDSALLRARQMVERDIGYVGEVTSVDSALLKTLVENGYLPVVASVAADASVRFLHAASPHVLPCM